ncbi:hypothetical protein ACIOEZ_17460 [Streptomyces sp. NPDC087866]
MRAVVGPDCRPVPLDHGSHRRPFRGMPSYLLVVRGQQRVHPFD